VQGEIQTYNPDPKQGCVSTTNSLQRNIREKRKFENVKDAATNVDICGHVVIFPDGATAHNAFWISQVCFKF